MWTVLRTAPAEGEPQYMLAATFFFSANSTLLFLWDLFSKPRSELLLRAVAISGPSEELDLLRPVLVAAWQH